MDDRARLTPVDVAFLGVAVFMLGILIDPIYTLLNANLGSLGTGDAYMVRLIIPGALVAVFVTIYQIAIQGQ